MGKLREITNDTESKNVMVATKDSHECHRVKDCHGYNL